LAPGLCTPPLVRKLTLIKGLIMQPKFGSLLIGKSQNNISNYLVGTNKIQVGSSYKIIFEFQNLVFSSEGKIKGRIGRH
jgi:hypothetical protein